MSCKEKETHTRSMSCGPETSRAGIILIFVTFHGMRERYAARVQPVAGQGQHVDSSTSSVVFAGGVCELTIARSAPLRSVTLSIELCPRLVPTTTPQRSTLCCKFWDSTKAALRERLEQIPTASVDCKWAAWRAFGKAALGWEIAVLRAQRSTDISRCGLGNAAGKASEQRPTAPHVQPSSW